MTSTGVSIRRSLTALAGVALVWLAASPAAAQKDDPIVQLLDRDAIPAIRNPRFAASGKASLRSNEKVLGVIIGGEAHAYPLIDLDRHEVVDDVVAGTPIAASR